MDGIKENITLHLNESGVQSVNVWSVTVNLLCTCTCMCRLMYSHIEYTCTGAAGELMRLNETVFEEKDNITNSTREVCYCSCPCKGV